jgi:hypothetical protein
MATLGQVAFEAYNKHRGGMNHQGDKTPDWDDLPLPIREAWDVAAKTVVDQELNKTTKAG